MDARHGLAAILRDGRPRGRPPQDEGLYSCHARANLDVGHGLRHDLVTDRVIGADGAVVEVAGVGALLVPRSVESAVRALESRGSAILAEAAFGADAVRDMLHRIIGRGLIRNAPLPTPACAFHPIPP